MFSVGDFVVYSSFGVCTVSEIKPTSFGDDKRSYYYLIPHSDVKSVIYVPVDSEKLVSQMRYVMTESDINQLIDSFDTYMCEWIPVDTKRKEFCATVIKSGNAEKIIGVINMMRKRQDELKGQSKKFHVADERVLRDAQKVLYSEFSYVLNIPVQEIDGYISNKKALLPYK